MLICLVCKRTTGCLLAISVCVSAVSQGSCLVSALFVWPQSGKWPCCEHLTCIHKHVPSTQIYAHQLISRQACRLSILFAAAEHSRCCSVDEDIRSEMSATISSLSWSAAAGILSAGTSTGRVAFWKHEQSMVLSSSSSAHHMDADPSVHWLPQRGMTVAGRVDDVVWGRDDRCTLCVYIVYCLSVLVACTPHSV